MGSINISFLMCTFAIFDKFAALSCTFCLAEFVILAISAICVNDVHCSSS